MGSRDRARVVAAPVFLTDGGRSLRAFLHDQASILSAEPDWVIGAWYDVPHERVVLSLVRLVPDRAAAVALGLAWRQHEIYDLAARRSIPTRLP
ncbi:hypothetical protein [Actinokineospora inagensis]|uniref:hypothetical protein n=1 Tax=Actinokineospora inagensis TaxID=103730 RepID=UPI0012F9B581|nr:hypothetical protein [Actinokineospora inagensis]